MPYKAKWKRDAYDKRRQQKRTELLRRYKRWHGCQDCGIKDPRVLVFHHLRDKVMSVSSKSLGRARLAIEIKKCVVLCANCHMRKHMRP